MPLGPALLLPRSSAVTEHVHVLPIHRRVRLGMEGGIVAASVLLLVATLAAHSLSTYTACTTVLTALLCGGCFAHLRVRERRGFPDSPRKSTMLATLIVCVFLAALSDTGMVHGQRGDAPGALVSALRHGVLPLGLFSYWLVFCGPMSLRWRAVLPFVPMLGWLCFAAIRSAQARQVRWPWASPGLSAWGEAAVLVALMVMLFAAGLVLLKLVKAYLVDAGMRSRAFGDWDAGAVSRQPLVADGHGGS